MSISEMLLSSPASERRSSRSRLSPAAARPLGASGARSSALRPLITGAPRATARASGPRSMPCSSIQCRRPAWTSVNGRRSSTEIATRFGRLRITAACRTRGRASRRETTSRVSSVKMLLPGSMPAAVSISSRLRRLCPLTSTDATAKRGDLSSQPPVSPHAPRPMTTRATTPARPAMTRARRATRRRSRERSMRWRPISRPREARSSKASIAARGDSAERLMPSDLPQGLDLGLERDAELRLDALARHVHQRLDVGGGGSAPVDDEVGVLGGDLGAVVALALESHLLDEAPRRVPGRVLPHAARGGQSEGLVHLLFLEPLLDVLLDVGGGAPVQAEPRPDEHGAGRRRKHAVAEGARPRLELAHGAVGVEEVDSRDEVPDEAVGRPRVHRHRPADGGGDADEALDAAEVEGRRLADEPGQAHARARHGLLAVEVGAPEAALELEHNAAEAAVAREQVVAAAHDFDGKLLALREGQRESDVLDVLGDDEDVGRSSDAQGW